MLSATYSRVGGPWARYRAARAEAWSSSSGKRAVFIKPAATPLTYRCKQGGDRGRYEGLVIRWSATPAPTSTTAATT